MVVEKNIGGKPVFLSYLPAGSYVGEMALIDGGRRTATVRAAIKSEVIRLDGTPSSGCWIASPTCSKAKKEMASREALNSFIEAKKDSFGGVVDMYSSVASFLLENGIGEATDVLLIDENLCVGCDNCEKACADSHEGLSRLNREAGKHLRAPARADIVPALRASALHGRLPAQRDPSRAGRRGVHRRHLHRLRQLPAQLPLWRDPARQGAAQEARPARLAARRHRPGPGRAAEEVDGQAVSPETPKKAIKCDMCSGIKGGPACVRACPTGAAIRVAPENS
jgi:cGMP-dependent protein kinase 2